MILADLISSTPVVVAADSQVRDAVALLRHHRINAVVVSDNNRPVGIFTERELIELVAADSGFINDPLAAVMQQPVHQLIETTPLTEALWIMDAERICHLVVVDKSGEIEGLLARQEIIERLFVQRPIPPKSGQAGPLDSGLNTARHQQDTDSLRYHRAQLRTLIDTLPDLVWLKDPDGRYLECNSKFERLFGASRSEIIGKSDYDFVDAELAAFFRRHDRAAMAAGKPSLNEERVVYADDGHEELLETIKTPMFDDLGNLIGVLGIAHDITQRKQSEVDLIESREKLRLFIEHVPVSLAMFDKEMRYLAVSNRWLRDFDLVAGNILGRSHYEVFPDIPERWKAVHRRVLAGEVMRKKEDRFDRLDGSVQWLRWEVRPWRTAENEVGGIVIFSEDITEQKLAELELIQSEERLRSVVEHMPMLLAAVDEQGVFLAWNSEAEKVSGYSAEELIGVPNAWELLYPDQEYREKMLSDWARRGDFRNWVWRLQAKDGSERFVEWSNNSSTNSIPGWASWGIGVDVTGQKRTEQALRRAQKMEAIGQLTGGIAHDFNNILGIILGNLDLLARELGEQGNRRIAATRRATQRAIDLTRQLLGFSRNQAAELVVCDIDRIIEEMGNLISRSVTPAVEVEHHFTDDLWPTEIDPGDFQDALLNLVINARDAMPDGGKLILETSNMVLDADYCMHNPIAVPGDYVQLSVSDNGTGIAPEQQERIFEPFFTTKPQGKGTGLGLAMVYGFVKRSRGHIKVYSEPGIGTTLRIYLPRVQHRNQPSETSTGSSETSLLGEETILVVDDETGLLELAQLTLEALGYRVLTAIDGHQALALLEQEPTVALLFSDVVMPGGMNGYELAEQAKSSFPELKVLLTSGYTEKALAHNGQARFSANLLNKPYRQPELARRIRQLLDSQG